MVSLAKIVPENEEDDLEEELTTNAEETILPEMSEDTEETNKTETTEESITEETEDI